MGQGDPGSQHQTGVTLALALRIEVDAKEVRIMGSKSVLLRTLVAASNAKRLVLAVPVLN